MVEATPPSPRPARRDQAGGSLHDTVVDRLGRAIVSGELPAGSVLRSELIEEDYGTSRSVVREAARVLEAMGLIATRRRVGITVQPRSEWQVFDPRIIRWRLDGSEAERADQLRSLNQLRAGIEPVSAGLAAAHATPEQAATMVGSVMEMARWAKAQDLEAYLEADIVFHTTLLQASGNEMLAALDGVVAEVLAGRTHHDLMPVDPNPEAIRLHGDVAQAIQAGDPAGATRAMQEIIDEAAAAVAAVVGS
ncbi:FadR/GntR family transcriptional regulator [Arsenicicoccus sp. oral taxon 190]|uniref:FadR/GntR family transcriptional regulator n=1 Tax=Arsenicicoccus sp. oral taxon 190 TaxID=1658671 RepID=UPI00067A3DB0|nr:FadR/GntR family transcriptional regulator [Arsenicicoccus sp. oral taxon 190]AKT51454.1 GntR family transcriptional regulator [Arsenicicoccus sp. oral taxon 190]